MDTRYCLHPTITKTGVYPCGNCPVCRMKYRKQMAVRIYMEKSIEKPAYSYFITLTYNDANIPMCSGRPAFDKQHISTFLDTVKHKLSKLGFRQRYFLTCEYGEEGYRPHYHYIALLYRDNLHHGSLRKHQYLHDIVEPSWHRGFCYEGTVSLPSIMYCTAYALKDDEALERDWRGFEEGRPFRLFSLRPGLGLTDQCVNWWTEYAFNDGSVRGGITIHLPKRAVSTGLPVGIKRKIKDTYPDVYEEIKAYNKTFSDESMVTLYENNFKYGGFDYLNGSRKNIPIDTAPDNEIKVFRKACRELAKRQRKPLK